METSRILVAPGVRTISHARWREATTTAVAAVLRRPDLWLLGMLGFSLRGGVVLLTLPMIVLPTQVEARMMLGDLLGSSGFSERFWLAIALMATGGALVVIAALLILARVELASFAILSSRGRTRDVASSPGTGGLFTRLFAVQLATFIALVVAASPTAAAAAQRAYDEVVRPTSSASIYVRVFETLGPQLLFFVVALVLVEMASSLATRELLVGGSMRSALAAAPSRLFRFPARTLGTSLINWTISAALVLPAIWAIGVGWSAVRGTFLRSLSLSDLGDDLGMFLVAFGLAGVFALALAATGFASALRAALWSVDRVR